MWQYLIDNVDYIFNLYNDTKEYDEDPEWILIDLKHAFIMHNYKDDGRVPFHCYACAECQCECKECPIAKKAGICAHDTDSAFQRILKAIIDDDKDEFIRQVGRLKDAWE